MRYSRSLSSYLYYADTFPQQISSITVDGTIGNGSTNKSLIMFPFDWYPLDENGEITLHWLLETMPTGSTFVNLTPFSFPWLLIPGTAANTFGFGHIGTGVGTIMKRQVNIDTLAWDSFNATNNRVDVKRYSWRKTAVDLPNVTNQPSGYDNNGGTTHSVAMGSGENVGFLTEHDGTNATGMMKLFATVSYEVG